MLNLRRLDSNHADFCWLVPQLDADLRQRYGDMQDDYAPYNLMPQPISVVVGYLDGQPVACGAFKPFALDGTVEIKRMFVRPEVRGRGYSRQVLQELEGWAAEAGYHSAVLETAIRQPEAIGLYRSMGYSDMEKYGPYRDLPESICLRKSLRK